MAKANGNMWELRNEQTTGLGCVGNRCDVHRIVLGCCESFCLWGVEMKGLAICKTCGTDHSDNGGKCRGLFGIKPVQAWNGEGIPPVGIEVNFWVDEESVYRKGVVVYSSEKGATVDIGYLASSGEHGDFALITAEDRKRELAIAELYKIGSITMDDASELYSTISAGKIPGVKLE